MVRQYPMHDLMAFIPSSHIMLVGGTHSRYPDSGVPRVLTDSLGLVGGREDDGASALSIDTGLKELEGIDHIPGVHGHFRRDFLSAALGKRVVLYLFAENLRYLGRGLVFQVVGIFVHIRKDHFGIAVRGGPPQLPFVKGIRGPPYGLNNFRG